MKVFDSHGELTEEASSIITRCKATMGAVVQGSKWITATPILVGSEQMARELIELGADEVLAIGVAEGVRAKPQDDESLPTGIKTHCLKLSFEGDMMDGIRGAEGALDSLDAESLALIDRFDPERRAITMRTIFSSSDTLAGRRVFGARREDWQALEDKTIIDQFWDDAGVQRVASVNVQLTLDDLRGAFAEINQGSGVVVAGDSRTGFHGGASRTRWADNLSHLTMIIDDLSRECDTARVMPYLEGVSCSIHGWVFPNGEQISLRPCEMLVTRAERETHFDYHGAATSWRPSEEIHRQMTSAAERAGSLLASRYQYRGVFTVDGIATDDGFYPTELNPRFGGALGRMSGAFPDLPILVMHYATIEGHSIGVAPRELKELIISAADAKPVIRGMIELEIPCPEPQTFHFKRARDAWVQCREDQDPDAQAKWGSGVHGSIAFANVKHEVFERGEATIHILHELLMVLKSICLGDKLAERG